MKTSELIGPALDWAVAKCDGATDTWRPDGPFWWNGVACIRDFGHDVRFTPSTDWSHADPLPLIEREWISVYQVGKGVWKADIAGQFNSGACPTPLIAAMRCYVASKLGDEVEIPEELCK